MSAKAINEATGKGLLRQHIKCDDVAENRWAIVTEDVNWGELTAQHPWLLTEVSLFIVYLVLEDFTWSMEGRFQRDCIHK